MTNHNSNGYYPEHMYQTYQDVYSHCDRSDSQDEKRETMSERDHSSNDSLPSLIVRDETYDTIEVPPATQFLFEPEEEDDSLYEYADSDTETTKSPCSKGSEQSNLNPEDQSEKPNNIKPTNRLIKHKKKRGYLKRGCRNFPTSNKKPLTGKQKLKRIPIKSKKGDKVEDEFSQGELVFMVRDGTNKDKRKPDDVLNYQIWVGDTGASTHMTNYWDGFCKVKQENSKAIFAQTDLTTPIKWSGEWKGVQQIYENGNKKGPIGDKMVMTDVLYVPTLTHNLYSITKGTSEGGILSNDGDVITLKFKDHTIRFDYKIRTKSGHVMAAVINPIGIMQDVSKDDLIPENIN
jgi:hypothetical protein